MRITVYVDQPNGEHVFAKSADMDQQGLQALVTNVIGAIDYPQNLRRARIAAVYLKHRVLKDGVMLKANDLRSNIGNLVAELNAQSPDLKVTQEELLDYARDLAQAALDKAFDTKTKQTK